jgi:hypothetical protein
MSMTMLLLLLLLTLMLMLMLMLMLTLMLMRMLMLTRCVPWLWLCLLCAPFVPRHQSGPLLRTGGLLCVLVLVLRLLMVLPLRL